MIWFNSANHNAVLLDKKASLWHLLLVEASKINFLHISHVENILQKCKMTEHVLVWHLNRECSLCSDALNWNEENVNGVILIMMMSLTCFLNVHFANVLKLPDGNVQGAECPGPANASTAVHHNGWTQLMTSPCWRHDSRHLSLLLPHTLQTQSLVTTAGCIMVLYSPAETAACWAHCQGSHNPARR